MRHHIVIKFLAVFLCAASLLGAVGSGLGLLAVTELDLRDRTLEEAYKESVGSLANSLANELAVRYASRELGGAEETMIDHYYGSYWMYSTFDLNQVSYTILDEAGNVLVAVPSDTEEKAAVYEIVTPGLRYIRVLDTMTQDAYEEMYNPVTQPTYAAVPEVEPHVYIDVPRDGCLVGAVHVTYADGSWGEYGIGSEALANLLWFSDTQLQLRLFNYQYSPPAETLIDDLQIGVPVVGMTLMNTDGLVVLDAADPDGLVQEFSENGPYILFRPLEGTEDPQTHVYDAVAPEGQFVSTCFVEYAGGYEESVSGDPDIGFLGYDEEGYLVFTANVPGLMEWRSEPVVHISFGDRNGNLIYEARDYGSVGQFTMEEDMLVFRSREAGAMPQPSVSEGGIYLYDDVPPGGYAVMCMELWLEDGREMTTIRKENDHLGLVDHDSAGNVIFTARDWKDFVFSKPAQVRYIRMSDMDGRVLYEAYQQGQSIGTGDPVGFFAYDEGGKLVFGPITDTASFAAYMGAREATEEEQDAQEETVPETTEVPGLTDQETRVENTEEPAEETVPAVTEEASVPDETVESTVSVDAPEAATVPEQVSVSEETYPAAEDEEIHIFGYYDVSAGEHMVVQYAYETAPTYTVKIEMGPGALRNQYEWVLLEQLVCVMNYLVPALIVSLVLFAVTAVYLCCAAGRRPGSSEIRASGLNCVPIDLYLMLAAGGTVLCAYAVVEGCGYLLSKDARTAILFAGLASYAASLLMVGFCFAFAAQVKTPHGYFWCNSLCGRSLKLLVWLWKKFTALCRWFWRLFRTRLIPLLLRLVKAFWKLICFFVLQLKRGLVWLFGKTILGMRWLNRVLGRFLSMLPLTWQFLLIGFSLVVFLYIMIRTYKVGYILIGFGVFFGVILYAASAFGILLENAKRMRKGDLDSKVDDRLLIGTFREFADELNGLADVAVVAAQKQLKSERMKTELITNVSHDIKTPLTSIINYVDLMEKPHSHEEQAAYLEVLSRQSQRLKKLIDDLMEMSKASTGNMAVEITRVNAGEAVTQALGEFADKLDKAQLIPVFRQPDREICMMADGRLVWRVLSNLLSNSVKYALPGTRVYIDLMEFEGKVVLSVKNISKEPLNVSAEELLERFVRGDTARNTEGSGLGLNIAKSLMELQKGKMELLVDGDLFKVTLIFPGV